MEIKMKVIIGKQIYDSKRTPIMVILEDYNKEDICNMVEDESMYFEAPDSFTDADVERFIKENYDSNWESVRIAE
jgi:hypothetical protein